LAACGLGASLATALAEFLWYGLATGADPWRIAAANLMPGQSLRPAVIVLLLGLAAAAIPVLHAPRRVVPPARQSWTM